VHDAVFPAASSEIFVTCSHSDIRVWNASTRAELLRIRVPNLECLCVDVMGHGRSIVSGWDDGKIRAFYPESGRLQYVITDAHADAVTAVACTHDNTRLVSGGSDGRVRVWNVAGRTQVMEHSFKEHKKAVTSVQINADDTECLSSSADGSCIVWNLVRGVRSNALFASTVFKSILYHPDESQLLTCGSDRKLSYWDASDCTAIRILEGSTAEIRALDIEPDGIVFVAGGVDKLVKVWYYDEGSPLAVGAGHSGAINAVRIAPNQRRIVSVGEEGAIFVWTMPAVGAKDMAAEGYVAKAGVEDEVDDVAAGLAKLRADGLASMDAK
jgi:WD40 repeat protein